MTAILENQQRRRHQARERTASNSPAPSRQPREELRPLQADLLADIGLFWRPLWGGKALRAPPWSLVSATMPAMTATVTTLATPSMSATKLVESSPANKTKSSVHSPHTVTTDMLAHSPPTSSSRSNCLGLCRSVFLWMWTRKRHRMGPNRQGSWLAALGMNAKFVALTDVIRCDVSTD
jgi:uncharacterized protein YjiS (DUF1127 family)